MASFLDLLPQARALTTLSDPATETLIEALLGQLLLVEGPPVNPIPGVSEDISDPTIIRSLKGRPWLVARTWVTGPWQCLLMDTPSVPMGRPITLKAVDGQQGPARTITDSKSTNFQLRIIQSCHQLGIAAPTGEGAVHAVFGNRSFVAWRPREEDEPMNRAMRGDVDNFAKNTLDGLQKSGVLPNDRGVFRLTASKEAPAAWEMPPAPLEEILRQVALARHAQGVSHEAIQDELRISRAHLARIFPDYKVPRSIRTPNPAAGHAAAQQAFALIQEGQSYHQARKETGAPAGLLRSLLAAHLRPRVLGGKTTIHDLARELQLDPRTASGIFRGDKEAQKSLQKAAKASLDAAKPLDKAQAKANLQKALKDVLQGQMTVPDAAHKHRVNVGSLRSRLARLKNSEKPGPAAPGKKTAPAKARKAQTKPKQ